MKKILVTLLPIMLLSFSYPYRWTFVVSNRSSEDLYIRYSPIEEVIDTFSKKGFIPGYKISSNCIVNDAFLNQSWRASSEWDNDIISISHEIEEYRDSGFYSLFNLITIRLEILDSNGNLLLTHDNITAAQLEEPRDGYWIFAIDDALLETARLESGELPDSITSPTF